MNLKVGGLYYSSGGMPNLVYEIVKLTEELMNIT